MRKIIGILMALCLLTVFVSSASAWCDRYGHCTDTLDPVKVRTNYAPLEVDDGYSFASAEGWADAYSTPCTPCPSASFQAGTTTVEGAGTMAFGSASSSGGGAASAEGFSITSLDIDGN